MSIVRAIVRFIRTYKLFSLAVIASVAAGVLTVSKHSVIANWVLATVSVIALIPIIVRMVRDIRSGLYGVDILAALAIGTSVILQQYWAAIIIVLMLSGGESLEDFAASRAQGELKTLLKHAPQHAHLLRKNSVVDVAATEVREGDRLEIRPGEIIPVDAVILDGGTTVDESSLTGESLPQPRDAGDKILSGSINLDGLITVQATHSAADSQYQQIVRLVRAAAEHPAPFVRLADRYSIPFTVVALTIAGVAWILSHEPIRFLEVIVVATPCPLILATPIALIAGMSRASRDGVIIKTGTALEQLAGAKVFAFDKTGTLTHGEPEVSNVTVFYPFRKQEVLSYAAAVEQASNHVLAKAIRNAAEQQKLKVPKTKHVKEVAGYGLEAHIQKCTVLVGRLKFLQERSVVMPKQPNLEAIKGTATYVAIDGKLAGVITFQDTIRKETKPTLRLLRKLGVRRTIMITGDSRAAAETIASELGISHVIAEALPGEKVSAIESIKEHPTAFVGDGVNDAPVLMAADVGIALGARGSTAASESADIVIMKDDLRYVVRAVAVSQRAFRIATESIAVGITLSIVLMLIFATGRFSPVVGAVTQEVLDVLVIFNALRAHQPGRLPSLR